MRMRNEYAPYFSATSQAATPAAMQARRRPAVSTARTEHCRERYSLFEAMTTTVTPTITGRNPKRDRDQNGVELCGTPLTQISVQASAQATASLTMRAHRSQRDPFGASDGAFNNGGSNAGARVPVGSGAA